MIPLLKAGFMELLIGYIYDHRLGVNEYKAKVMMAFSLKVSILETKAGLLFSGNMRCEIYRALTVTSSLVYYM